MIIGNNDWGASDTQTEIHSFVYSFFFAKAAIKHVNSNNNEVQDSKAKVHL